MKNNDDQALVTNLAFTFSKLKAETPEHCVKSV